VIYCLKGIIMSLGEKKCAVWPRLEPRIPFEYCIAALATKLSSFHIFFPK
jgi:hypothetical protein